MTVVISMHRTSLMHTPSSKVLPYLVVQVSSSYKHPQCFIKGTCT